VNGAEHTQKPLKYFVFQRNGNGTQHARNPKILSRLFPGASKKKSSQQVLQRSRVFWQSRSRACDRAPRTHVTTVVRSQTDRQTDRARGSQSRISPSTPPPPILYLLLASLKRKLCLLVLSSWRNCCYLVTLHSKKKVLWSISEENRVPSFLFSRRFQQLFSSAFVATEDKVSLSFWHHIVSKTMHGERERELHIQEVLYLMLLCWLQSDPGQSVGGRRSWVVNGPFFPIHPPNNVFFNALHFSQQTQRGDGWRMSQSKECCHWEEWCMA
jgi:hypothetical protein